VPGALTSYSGLVTADTEASPYSLTLKV